MSDLPAAPLTLVRQEDPGVRPSGSCLARWELSALAGLSRAAETVGGDALTAEGSVWGWGVRVWKDPVLPVQGAPPSCHHDLPFQTPPPAGI